MDAVAIVKVIPEYAEYDCMVVKWSVLLTLDEQSNAYSHLLLALKAWSSGLPTLALSQVDKALELDPLFGMAQSMKALIIG